MQVRSYVVPPSTQAVVLKPLMKSIGGLQWSVEGLQRSVNKLKEEKDEKKEKDEKEEKEKHFNKNLDDFGDHLESVVQNLKNIQSKGAGCHASIIGKQLMMM